MPGLTRVFFTLSIILFVAGIVTLLLARANLPLGRLPGDLSWRGRNWSIFVPIGSSLLLSVILSLVLWAVSRLR